MNRITKFYFQKAKYLIGDENGNEVYMCINYRDAKFEIHRIKVNKGKEMGYLEKKVRRLAKDLILRKHEFNFFAKISA